MGVSLYKGKHIDTVDYLLMNYFNDKNDLYTQLRDIRMIKKSAYMRKELDAHPEINEIEQRIIKELNDKALNVPEDETNYDDDREVYFNVTFDRKYNGGKDAWNDLDISQQRKLRELDKTEKLEEFQDKQKALAEQILSEMKSDEIKDKVEKAGE